MSISAPSRVRTRARLRLLLLLLAMATGLIGARVSGEPMMTRWARELSPDNVWAEYPRPQLVRARWLNLNGPWDYAVSDDDGPGFEVYEGRILVPFPIESQLSGVERRLGEGERLWYRRAFVLPTDWQGQRIKLHFGAVDWETIVFLNGHPVGSHRGGYDAFSFDLTSMVDWTGTNELLVVVADPTEGDQPRGKQSRNPEGIFYLPSSGIWQTVWLEPVPPVGIQGLNLRPDWAEQVLRVRVLASAADGAVDAECVASLEGRAVGRASGPPGVELTVPLAVKESWSPETPTLYDLTVTLRRGGDELDRVTSYFGLREIRLGTDDNGYQRLFLNGKPVFQLGVLDQGYWPDGLYTAPSDEAMRSDLETVKRLGFNLVRKHVKVEPARWYYWADRLGLLVWQDMPSGNNASLDGRRQFRSELHRMMEQLANHPCVVMWVLFNEGWGQFETEQLVRGMMAADPTRLINNASGWTDARAGDVIDLHSYPDPLCPATEPRRAPVLGEFGGLGLAMEGHKWSEQTWGYQGVADGQALTRQYCSLIEKVWVLQRTSGLAAAVYTQLTDVETECNGFLTYDREVLKVDMFQVQTINAPDKQPTIQSMPLPNAQIGAYRWRFTTDPPEENWPHPDFDATLWREGTGGFGTVETPGTHVRTQWDSSDIWLRRTFELPSEIPPSLVLAVHHDEAAEIYLNGVLAAELQGFTVGYRVIGIRDEALATLRPGPNLVAVHCHQTSGGQYIDVGLVAETDSDRKE